MSLEMEDISTKGTFMRYTRVDKRTENAGNRRWGFTLIELLVVVAIIALLIAILLPSLAKAKMRAASAACLANLKSLGLGTYMYQADNNAGLPRAGNSTKSGIDWVFWQAGRDLNSGALVPYQGNHFNPKLYICPSDPLTRPAGKTYFYSYTANLNIFTLCAVPAYPAPNSTAAAAANTSAGIPNAPLKFSNILSPSSKILMIDESSDTMDDAAWAPQNYVATATPPTNLLSNRHETGAENAGNVNSGSGNANFADGHADVLKRADAQNLSGRYFNPLIPG